MDTPGKVHAILPKQKLQNKKVDAKNLLLRAVTKLSIREKAIISNNENPASITPTASPSRPVMGGGANAAMATTTSAKLTVAVAMYWKAVAALSEGYGCAGEWKKQDGWQSVAPSTQ